MKRSKKEVLDADFAAARAGVLDMSRVSGPGGPGGKGRRISATAPDGALPLLSASGAGRVRAILEALSYRDDAVPETAAAKAACGAPNFSK